MKIFKVLLILLLLAFSLSAEKLTKEKIEKMVDANVEKSLIISLIKSDCVDFKLTADLLIEWKGKVDSEIVNAINDCLKPKNNQTKKKEVVSKSVLLETFKLKQFQKKKRKLKMDLYTDKIIVEYKDKVFSEIKFTELLGMAPLCNDNYIWNALLYPNDKSDLIVFKSSSIEENNKISNIMNKAIKKYRNNMIKNNNYETKTFNKVSVRKKGKLVLSKDYIEFIPKKSKHKEYRFKIKISRIKGIHIVYYKNNIIVPIDKTSLGDDEYWGEKIKDKTWFTLFPVGLLSVVLNQSSIDFYCGLAEISKLPIPNIIRHTEIKKVLNL